MSHRQAWSTLLALGLLASCVSVASAAGKSPEARVEISHFTFAPGTLTVSPGTKVVWTNRDEEPHIVVSAGNQFASSKALDTGDAYAVVFDKPGTYAYFCSIHPHMVGTVVVK
jgi:plastocyanin